MDKKYISIGILCFLISAGVHGQQVYKLDLSLKQDWSEELQEKTKLSPRAPYAIEYSNPDKTLVIGLLVNDPKEKKVQDQLIKKIEAFKPDITLEQSKTQPSTREVLGHLKQYDYKIEDLAYFQVLEILNQHYGPRMSTQQELAKNAGALIEKLNENLDFKSAGPFSINGFKNWFQAKTKRDFTLKNVQDGELVAPMGVKGTTYLQTFSSRMDEIQDKYFLEQLVKVLNQKEYKKIAVLRALSKFSTEGRVLTKMMGGEPKIFFKP